MVAVLILDKRFRCDFINRVAETLTGRSLAEARGRPLADLLCRGDAEAWSRTMLSRMVERAEGGEGEERLADRDGAERPFAFRVAPLRPGDPESGRVLELFDLSGETGTARALMESEQRLRLAVEATGIGIWDVNAVTGERRWSHEFKRILGLPPDAEADDRLFADAIDPADRDWVIELYRQVYSRPSPGTYNAEFRIRRASDGAVRWVATTGRITFDAEGRALRGVGTLRDIHDRRKGEDALRESEERLRVALVAGRMGTWRYDLVTGEQQWDDTQHRIFGVPAGATPSRELFLSLVHPDDLDAVAFDPAALPIGSFLDAEFRIRRPDGAERWISSSAIARIDPTGRPVEMIGVNRDITAQKQAEAELRISEERNRLATEANEVGTWDYDLTTGGQRWSAQFRRLWGLPADAPSDPALIRPLVSDEAWKAGEDAFAAAADPAGDGRINLEYMIRRADDDARRWVMVSGQVFFDAARRKAVRAVGILLDVTARREAEERQRLIVRELNHRVKNNLAVVQAIVSQTIRMTPKPAEAFDLIQARLMAVSRTHDFLNLSDWGGVALVDLLKGELSPYAADDPARVTLRGPHVRLESTTALALGLIIHELASNAARHGALSAVAGRLDVSWTLTATDNPERPDIAIVWSETGGPQARAPRRTGFGGRLIEGSVKGNLDGAVGFDWRPEGLLCRLAFRLRPLIGTEATMATSR